MRSLETGEAVGPQGLASLNCHLLMCVFLLTTVY
ncbi:hypothetical protein BH10PLA2_BH10PLA2_33560 [soil metagenome]